MNLSMTRFFEPVPKLPSKISVDRIRIRGANQINPKSLPCDNLSLTRSPIYVELLFWKAKLNRIQVNQMKDVLSALQEVFRNDWALCNCTALIVDCGTMFLNNFRDFSQNTNFLVNFIVKSKSFLSSPDL